MIKRVLLYGLMLVMIICCFGCGPVQQPKKANDLNAEIATALGGDQHQGVLRYRLNIINQTRQKVENVAIKTALYPEIAQRLKSTNQPAQFEIAALNIGQSFGIRNGIVLFNSEGLTKAEIAKFSPLLELELTWTQDGKKHTKKFKN